MLTSNVYTNRVASYAASDQYRSLPVEQREKAIALLAQKSIEGSKNTPVYLQVELAKSEPLRLPFNAVA